MGYSNNNSDDKYFQRFAEVTEYSYVQQKIDRDLHQLMISFLLGDKYPTSEATQPRTSIALLSMAFRTMSRHLMSKAPRVLVNTADPKLKSWAENGEISVNKRILRMRLDQEMRECVGQSLSSFGTMFFAPGFVGTEDGMKLDLRIQAIDRADFGFDLNASTLETADYCFHDYWEPLVDVRENPLFEESTRTRVDANGQYLRQAGETTNVRALSSNRGRLHDYVRIRCGYDRRRNKLIYFPRYQPNLRLMEVEWMGPREGPYDFLYYEKPPGQATPIAPLAHLLFKHRAFNVLDCRATHQQQAAKGLLLYTNAGQPNAERVVNATDLQSSLQDNGAVRFAHIGGADQATVAMAEKQKRDFSYATNGLVDQFQAQAPTLGQERLLRGSANEMAEDMAGWAYQFNKRFAERMFWFDIRDPDPKPQILTKTREGLSYPLEWTARHRQFAMDMELDVDVEPYSYIERSPENRLADTLGAIQIIMGMGPQAAAQGISVDVEAVVKLIGKYKNLPELYDCLILNQDPTKLQQMLGARQAGSEATDPNKPNGNYTRTSESDGSGAEMELIRAMGRKQEAIAA